MFSPLSYFLSFQPPFWYYLKTGAEHGVFRSSVRYGAYWSHSPAASVPYSYGESIGQDVWIEEQVFWIVFAGAILSRNERNEDISRNIYMQT